MLATSMIRMSMAHASPWDGDYSYRDAKTHLLPQASAPNTSRRRRYYYGLMRSARAPRNIVSPPALIFFIYMRSAASRRYHIAQGNGHQDAPSTFAVRYMMQRSSRLPAGGAPAWARVIFLRECAGIIIFSRRGKHTSPS